MSLVQRAQKTRPANKAVKAPSASMDVNKTSKPTGNAEPQATSQKASADGNTTDRKGSTYLRNTVSDTAYQFNGRLGLGSDGSHYEDNNAKGNGKQINADDHKSTAPEIFTSMNEKKH